MTVPAKRKSVNIELSINKFIKDNYATPNSYSVNYQDDTYDVSALNAWTDVNFLSHGAGRKGSTMVQIDVYTRTIGKSGTGDRYRGTLDAMCDKLHAAMHVDSIQVYDFADPTNPVAVSKSKLMVQNSDGIFREPESDQILDLEEGVARRCLTYRFRLVEDADHAIAFYD